MEEVKKKKRAYVLTSGGLDSTLAVKMLQEQGIDVTGVYISTGFCINSHQKKTGRFNEEKADVFKVSEELGIDLEVIDISQEYIPIITNPRYGWGKNVNPCIDCRIHMLKRTRELMEKNGFDFIATGEVLGQRPMSQRRHPSKIIEENSGLKGLLLRPLSAKLHRATEPEKNGWVNRETLGNISGRSRKPQMKLAEKYGLKTISAPAGGCCFLTDETYAVRFKDMLNDRKQLLSGDTSQPMELNSLMILATGRQIKIRRGLHLVIGRNEAENKLLEHYTQNQIILEALPDVPGPTAIIEVIKNDNNINVSKEFEEIWKEYLQEIGNSEEYKNQLKICGDFLKISGDFLKNNISSQELSLCASIVARYMKTKPGMKIIARLKGIDAHDQRIELNVTRFNREEILNKRLVMKANEKYFTSLLP
jgi:NH3-dependent NAD+ synthetase